MIKETYPTVNLKLPKYLTREIRKQSVLRGISTDDFMNFLFEYALNDEKIMFGIEEQLEKMSHLSLVHSELEDDQTI